MNHLMAVAISMVGGSAFMALAVSWLTGAILEMQERAKVRILSGHDHDSPRRNKIAAGDATYRVCYPLIQEMMTWPLLDRLVSTERVARHLNVGVESLPWKSKEFIATKALDLSLKVLLLVIVATWFRGIQAGLMIGIVIWLIGLHGIERGLARQAELRRQQIDRRLPYTIDLMALMMSAGATVYETIPVIVKETKGHAISEEFQRLWQGLEGGSKFEDCLISMRDRLGTDAVCELCTVVKQGVAQGTPLSDSFLNLADQMRLRRSQFAEKAAGQAQTLITFPAMVVMVACLIIIVSPFLISIMSQR